MPPAKYKLSFPCPSCGKTLTMNTPEAEGSCPSCQCVLDVSLTVTAKEPETEKESKPTLAWDRRAFRKNTAPTKPPLNPQKGG